MHVSSSISLLLFLFFFSFMCRISFALCHWIAFAVSLWHSQADLLPQGWSKGLPCIRALEDTVQEGTRSTLTISLVCVCFEVISAVLLPRIKWRISWYSNYSIFPLLRDVDHLDCVDWCYFVAFSFIDSIPKGGVNADASLKAISNFNAARAFVFRTFMTKQNSFLNQTT